MRDAFELDLCIVGGCGHVGLPLGLAFAERGLRVALHDINAAAVERVNAGEMPFLDAGAPEALRATLGKTLFATTDGAVVQRASAVVTVIGTPVDNHLNPDLSGVRSLVAQLAPSLRDGQLLILRSTLFPGVTEHVARAVAETGRDIDVAFCPERVAEGSALHEIRTLPQIVAGMTPRATERARELFALLTPRTVELSPREAELAKLFTNTWRYINFAVSNQFYWIAQEAGLDFYRVYSAMTADYPRMRGFPRPGFAAGPCLFKDTMQLSAFAPNSFFLGHSAMLVNEGLPAFVVAELEKRLPLRDLSVGIAGMTFKAESDDTRDSLSFKLRKILRLHARRVLCSDPYVSEPDFVELPDLVRECDVIVIGAPHAVYRDYDFGDRKVVDVWNLRGRGGAI